MKKGLSINCTCHWLMNETSGSFETPSSVPKKITGDMCYGTEGVVFYYVNIGIASKTTKK
jgi:hypothetical protein